MRYALDGLRFAPYLFTAVLLFGFSPTRATETSPDKGNSPQRLAHVYIVQNDVKGIERLMREGLDIRATHYFGWSPLYAAARMGRTDIVRVMLQNGSSSSFRQATQDGDPNSLPLLAEVLGWTYYLSPHMWDAQSKARIDPANWREVAELLVKDSVEINEVFDWGKTERTYLSIAAEYNDFDMVKLLVKNGADVNLPADSWRAPLFWAVKNGNVPMAKWLLQHGANMYAVGIPENADMSTPIDHALRYSPEAAILLLNSGADPNAHAFLYWAIGQRHHGLLQRLIEKGVDVNAFIKRDSAASSPTPLGLAVLMSDADAVETLLRAGADPCKQDDAGYRAYDVAVRWKRITIMGVLNKHNVKRRCPTMNTAKLPHVNEGSPHFAQLQELIQVKYLQREAQFLSAKLYHEYGVLELTRNELYRELNKNADPGIGIAYTQRVREMEALDATYIANDYARGYRDTRSVEQDIDRKARSLQEENIYELLDQGDEVFDDADKLVSLSSWHNAG